MRRPNGRWGWITAGAVAAVYVLALPLAYVTGGLTCGGDGGSPYAAPASTRGELCDAAIPLILLVAPFCVVVGGLFAKRYADGRLFVAGLLGAAVALLAGGVLPALLPKECSEAELAEHGPASRECHHY